MMYDNQMRHPAHDYSAAGGYFITFVTHERKKMLGRFDKNKVVLSRAGIIVQNIWESLPETYPNLTLDAVQIMPDHVHCIIIVGDPKVSGVSVKSAGTLAKALQRLKGGSSHKINKLTNSTGMRIWQPGYQDRVIRNDQEFEKYRYYIETNPLRAWLQKNPDRD